MTVKLAKAPITPMRQRTQYTCMATSMTMALQACGHDCTEDQVNKVMGCRPGHGARWEDALACAQHYGCRAHLTVPATLTQVKAWTDAGKPVLIAWNPEGRPWSHASLVFDVTDGPEGRMVHVADPNIPNPEKTVRVVPEDEFYGKWYEKWPEYLVRRPACVIEREIDEHGRQIVASKKAGREFKVTFPYWDQGQLKRELRGSTGTFMRMDPDIYDDLLKDASKEAGWKFTQRRHQINIVFPDGTELDDPSDVEYSVTDIGLDPDGLTGDIYNYTVTLTFPPSVRWDPKTASADMADNDEKTETAASKSEKIKGKMPKQRNELVRHTLTPEGRPGRAGPHKNKGQRGTGQKGKGKGQRHPKHKKDFARMARNVAATYILKGDA